MSHHHSSQVLRELNNVTPAHNPTPKMTQSDAIGDAKIAQLLESKSLKPDSKFHGFNSLPATPTSAQPAAAAETARISLDDFQILKVLGKGAYGKVYQVRKVSQGANCRRIFAMKSVNKSRIADSKTDMRHTRTERDVLARVEHPFLITMVYAFETRHRLYFVQEFCRGGELFRLMEQERMFLEEHARFYLCEIASALSYLHSLDIVYRDLKTENVMLDDDGHIKLIDFGLSKILDDDCSLTHTFCGTVEYMAPEVVIKSPGHGKPADWWSFGIFTFDLLTGRSPFHSNRGKKETKERILRGKFTVPSFITPEAGDLMRKLLRKNVDRRLGSNGAEEIMEHAFFDQVDWDMVEDRAYQPPHVPTFNRKNDADVSQFDPRFTNRSPRESLTGFRGESGYASAESRQGSAEKLPQLAEKQAAAQAAQAAVKQRGIVGVMFEGFEYVAESVLREEELLKLERMRVSDQRPEFY